MEPIGKIFLTAGWYNLIMVNYEIDSDILKPYLPYKTEFDYYNGKTLVSLVGFKFANTKVRGIKFPFHSDFEEVNLRFYVRSLDANGNWKRGVVFLKEIVPRTMIALIANTIYKEKYIALPMKHSWVEKAESREIEYSWKGFGEWNSIKAISEKKPIRMKSGGLEEFIAEHYWGYTQIDPCCTGEYQVEHPTWNLFPVKSYEVQCNFEKLYGSEFKVLGRQVPQSVFVADGSEIAVRKGIKIRA